MKRIFFALIVSILALSACRKEDNALAAVNGEWYGTLIYSQAKVAELYIDFTDGKFVMYQKSGEQQRFYRYEGTYTIADDILNGVYSDGLAWGSAYSFRISGETMVLTALNGSNEMTVYTKTLIPEDVKSLSVAPPAKSKAL